MSPASAPIAPPEGSNRRFGNLRGVRWRIGLGILPSDASVDDLRRITADSRRRYASLRRHLLVDPHLPKDGNDSPDRVMDNPLSQNPDSTWGRFFRNAELERMVDQDLSRLYPEHGSYFQTMGCQSTLRRLLLLWCLKHPDCGYRQGMHELLAPLLYVLHADVEHLSQVRKLYEDHFVDKFDDFPFEDNDLSYNFDFKKFSESRKDEINSEGCSSKSSSVNKLDPEVQEIVLLSDTYGAEGELGVLISDKYLEHDAHCMFDALMSGGAVSMAKFFSPSPSLNSLTGLPPVIEASSALYYLLSIVDSSIHSHLIELGVEPQYFALRWLRVLFGREFPLENLVIIWDEIFSCDNSKVDRSTNDPGSSFAVLSSLRGAFISAFAVSMILSVRSSLLATENATSCLQRLLNFPANVDLKKTLAKTKSLQGLALDANNSTPLPVHNGIYERAKTVVNRGHSQSLESVSPRTPLSLVPESYWEEKWRDLHKAEKIKQSSLEKQAPNRKKGWSEKVKSSLLRTISAPSSSKAQNSKNDDTKVSVRRSLLEDLSKHLESDEHTEKTVHIENLIQKNSTQEKIEQHQNIDKRVLFLDEDKNISNSDEENTSSFSDSPGHHRINNSLKSSIDSNSSVVVYNGKCNSAELCGRPTEDSPHPVSDFPEVCFDADVGKEPKGERTESDYSKSNFIKPESGIHDRKTLSGKFQWLMRFGRNNGGEGTSEKSGPENTKNCNGVTDQNNKNDPPVSMVVNGASNSSVSGKVEYVDQNVTCSLRNLGQTMLDNIQVLESVFQHEQDQAGSMENISKNGLVGKGHVTARSALEELQKISNLLSEM